ncbi:MAG: hypothetical protein ABSG41_27390 [Bryobacteraceae bacterium]|jgi:hypothetical protein
MVSKLDYSEIVKQAEAAVASIKDGDLKTIAFGKILDTLLGQGGNPKEQDQGSSYKRAAKRKRTKSIAAKPDRRKGGPKGYVEELIEEDFFKTPKTLAAIRAELGNRGHHIPVTSLSPPMMLLCQDRRLRRQKAKDGKKQVFTYSNW